MSPVNLFELLTRASKRYPDKKAVFYKYAEGGYRHHTWKEIEKQAGILASFFASKGLIRSDKVAILSENRPEWMISDMAALSLGGVTVPIYTSLSSEEIQYILDDSAASWICVSGKTLFDKIVSALDRLPRIQGIVVFDKALLAWQDKCRAPLYSFTDLMQRAETTAASALPLVDQHSLASIIYTSGTTGQPKGVMLTHGNFIQNVLMCQETLKMGEADRHLSFLPLCHVFERTAGYYLMVHIGASIAYAENMDAVPKNILETKPTFLLGVPRFFEKIQFKVLDAVKRSGPIRHGLFAWAKELGRKERLGEPVGWINALLKPLAYGIVRGRFKKGLGGCVRFCVSGGAALPKDVAEFFYDLGIAIYEGYGLTETAPVISVNRMEKFRFGSVGIPLRGVEVRITEEGEIATKSACVMQGYFNKPAETAEVLRDGWFYTGDLGKVDHEGFLYITGRKKELIVTSGGKKVSPKPIEELLEKDPEILRCVLFGEGKKFISALIVPNRDAVLQLAKTAKLEQGSYTDLLKNKKIYAHYDEKIQQKMKALAPYEQIKYFALLENDFTQASGELTPTLKIKREVILSKYAHLLLPFYAL